MKNIKIFWYKLTRSRKFCKPGEHHFDMDGAPYYNCKKCGLWNDEYDFKRKINKPYGLFEFKERVDWKTGKIRGIDK